MGSATSSPWGLQPVAHGVCNTLATHQFELHFIVVLLECEYKEYEDRHVHHEGYETVVAVQEQEELLRGRGRGRGRRTGEGRHNYVGAWLNVTATTH